MCTTDRHAGLARPDRPPTLQLCPTQAECTTRVRGVPCRSYRAARLDLQACCRLWTRQRFITFPATSASPSRTIADTSSSTDEKVESNRWHFTIASAVGGTCATLISASSTISRACMICLPPRLTFVGSTHSSTRLFAFNVAGGSDFTPPCVRHEQTGNQGKGWHGIVGEVHGHACPET